MAIDADPTGAATQPSSGNGAGTAPASAPATVSEGLRRGAAALLLPLLLLTVAGTLRFYRLDHPPRIYFDETYYAEDARELYLRGVESGFAVHPPVGKWVIASGIAIFGFDPFGWRAAVAAAGTLTVLAVYLAGLRLFRRRGIAALAAFLLAIEGLAFTMSRIAMLDAVLALFVVLGFWLLLVDRDRTWAGTENLEPDPERPLPHRPHAYRWLAGLMFGLAIATKWSGLLPLGVAGLFVLVSEIAWRRRLTGRWHTRWWRVVASGLLTLVAVPAVVYVASYAGWFANVEQTRIAETRCPDGECALSVPEIADAWWGEQLAIGRFHRDLTAEHPYRASPLTWPLMTRPVAYYYESCTTEKQAEGECTVAPGNVAEIIGMGNPAIWYLALAALPVLVWNAFGRRDWRAWALLGFWLLQFLPWLATARPAFLFYMTPVVPFLCLALAYAGWRAAHVRLGRWVPAAIAVIAVAGFLFWYPVLTGMEIPRGSWELRIWMRSWI